MEWLSKHFVVVAALAVASAGLLARKEASPPRARARALVDEIHRSMAAGRRLAARFTSISPPLLKRSLGCPVRCNAMSEAACSAML